MRLAHHWRLDFGVSVLAEYPAPHGEISKSASRSKFHVYLPTLRAPFELLDARFPGFHGEALLNCTTPLCQNLSQQGLASRCTEICLQHTGRIATHRARRGSDETLPRHRP